jgi:hypothetical protein
MSTKRRWLAVAACALFLLRPMRAEAQPANQAGAGVDRVTLSDGATIELAGISEYPPRPDRWWRPDGTPRPEPPIANLLRPATPFPNRLKRVFVFNILADGQAEIDGPNGPKDETDPHVIYLGRSETTSARSLTQRHVVAAIRRAARIDLALDYDSGPWRTVATTTGREDKLAGRASGPRVFWESTSTDASEPQIWAAHNLDFDAKYFWLIAVDTDDILHQPRGTSELECGHVLIRTACFPDLRLKPVKEYRLVTHLADRRFRFKPEVKLPGAAPADDIVWGPGAEEDGAAVISAACRIHMKKGRIIAIDEGGKEWASKFGEWRSIGNFCLMTAVFPRVPLARVKEFRFQTRTVHHHIEFRNVSLHVGQKNPAQIYLDGKRYAPQAERKVAPE